MYTIKPNFTGRDKQIITEILNNAYEISIPYIKNSIKIIKELLQKEQPILTFEEKTVILDAIDESFPNAYSIKEIQTIRTELDRAETEAICKSMEEKNE